MKHNPSPSDDFRTNNLLILEGLFDFLEHFDASLDVVSGVCDQTFGKVPFGNSATILQLETVKLWNENLIRG